jgi:hypothetical protein
MLRHLQGSWERHANNIQYLLINKYNQWAKETERALMRAIRRGEPPQYLAGILNHALEDLRGPLQGELRAGIMRSATLATGGPLAGWQFSPKALKALAERIAKSDMYVQQSLLPAIGESILKHVEGGVDRETIQAALGLQDSKIAQAAGQVWAAIGETQKAALQGYQDEGKKVVPVRWELDPKAMHCQTSMKYGTFGCVTLAGTYMGGIDTLPTVPAGNTTCAGNCRCHLSLSFDGGKSFKRYSS